MSGELISTRGIEGQELSYSSAVLQGLAPDRGLYIPHQYPQLDADFLNGLAGRPYIDVFYELKSLFIDPTDISRETQYELAEAAYTQEKFPVSDGNIVPLTEVADGFFIQSLSLGPTAAFKDMALQPLGQDINHILEARDETLAMLGATSGDTGSAAEAAVKGLGRVGLIVLSPETGMSDFQKAQMGALTGSNISNVSIDGRFDACQKLVKAIKGDPEFADLGAVNSINWGRIASQIPYFVSGYLQAVDGNVGQLVDFVVPTGNFGNILAGYIAKKMGLPIRKLIVATNENNVVDTLIQTGTYTYKIAEPTSSPSMDISEASNYERVLFDLVERDPLKVRAYMEQFNTTGSVKFGDIGLPADALRKAGFDSDTSTEMDRLESIRWAYQQSGEVIDPHTADAVTVARRKAERGVPIVCMSTALPVKFEPFIREALGYSPTREPRFVGLEDNADGGFVVLGNDIDAVKAHIRTFRQERKL